MQKAERKYGKIRNQLVGWFLLLGIVPLIVVSTISYQSAKQALHESAAQELKNTSLEKIRFIDSWFDYRWMDLKKQAEDPSNIQLLKMLILGVKESPLSIMGYVDSYEWAQITSAMQNQLKSTWLEYDYIYDLFLIDGQGNILYTVVREDDLATNLYTGKYSKTRFAEAVSASLKNGLPQFSDYEYYGPSNDLLSAFITEPMIGEGGDIIGVFAIQIRLDRINELLKQDLDGRLSHYLVGEDGLLRSSILKEQEVLRRKVDTLAFNRWKQEGLVNSEDNRLDQFQVSEYIGPSGKEVMGIFQTITIRNSKWVLISEQDKSEVLASVTLLTRFELALLLVTATVITLFSINLSKRISKPISKLAEASQNIIDGDFDEAVVIETDNELGKLAEVFNRMVRSRKSYEQALRIQSEERRIALDQLEEQRFALAQHAIVAITDIKGDITYVNSKFKEISGYSESELIGKNHRLLNSGYHSKDFFRDMYLTISSGEIWNGEICNRAKNGSLYWVYTTIAPFKNDKGKINRYIAIRTDISEQKKAQDELRNAKEAAEMAAKAKSEFLASMSHEIRTPMNGVLGMLGLLMRGKLSEDQMHQARLALTSAESLLVLINDILDFSKIEAGKLEIEVLDFDLTSMLGDFSEAMAPKAQSKGVEFMLDVSGVTQTMVRGDPGRIRQIFTNLVSNAVKFTSGGEIIIKVELKEDKQSLRLHGSVSDTGIGVSADKLQHIFDSFTQVDASTTRKFGGTGLGLAIVKNLCQMMGGDIHVESALGEGSCFSFYIQVEPSNQSKLLMPSVDIKGIPILIVDDNATNREVLRRQLQLWGAEVSEAEHGAQALEMLEDRVVKKQKPVYKVALLDYQMPEMSGADLGKVIRENSRYDAMKMIMMTSICNRGDALMFAEIGFSGYFPKPATTSDLFNALAVILEGGEAMENAQPLVTHHYLQSLETNDGTEKNGKLHWPDNVRILLVEDNSINQTVAMGILEELSLSCETAENGLEAINILKKSEEKYPYTLVLMDCQMPEMDGYQATTLIRQGRAGERYKTIPIIAMTANAMKGDMEKCLAAGMNDYLSKPISQEGLESTLKKWLIKAKNTQNKSQNTGVISMSDLVWNQDSLLKRVNGKVERAVMLIDMFLSELPQYKAKLSNLKDNGDLNGMAETAHALKGISGNLGAAQLMSVCAKIEQEAKADNREKVDQLLDSISEYFDEIEETLTNFKNTI